MNAGTVYHPLFLLTLNKTPNTTSNASVMFLLLGISLWLEL